MFDIKPDIKKLIFYSLEDLDLITYEEIIAYICKININMIYDNSLIFITCNDQKIAILNKYVSIDYILELYIDYMFNVNRLMVSTDVLKKFFYQIPFYQIAAICHRCGKDLDGKYHPIGDQRDEMIAKYKEKHDLHHRKLKLLTKWLRIKLACRRIRKFIQKLNAINKSNGNI